MSTEPRLRRARPTSELRRALAAGVLGITAAVSCTFPKIGFQTESTATGGTATGGSGGALPTTSSPSSSSTSSHGGAGGHATTSSTTSTSSTSTTTGSTTDTCADPCDCDGDGDRAATAECDHDGGDCNDHDPDVHSKQTAWFTKEGSNGWDYDCSGQAEFEFIDELDCGALTSCDKGTEKWTGGPPPGCGESANYGTCAGFVFFNCYEQVKGARPQGCH